MRGSGEKMLRPLHVGYYDPDLAKRFEEERKAEERAAQERAAQQKANDEKVAAAEALAAEARAKYRAAKSNGVSGEALALLREEWIAARDEADAMRRKYVQIVTEEPVGDGIACANHVCGKACAVHGSAVSCPLCKGATYCGEACRYVDWARHACPNASLVSAKTPQTAFVPYVGEDMWSAADVAALPEDAPARQSWAVTTRVTPADVLVETRVDSLLPIDAQAQSVVRELPPNFLRGVAPRPSLDDYYIYISGGDPDFPVDIRLSGKIGGPDGRAVYEGTPNLAVAKLFGKMKSWRPSDWLRHAGHKAVGKGDKIVIWQDPAALAAWSNNQLFPTDEPTRIRVEIADQEKGSDGLFPEETHYINVQGMMDLGSAAKRGGLTGALAKQWSARMKAKFRGVAGIESLAQMFGVRATFQDVTIHLIFQMAKGSPRAKLCDIEVSFDQMHFTGDPRDPKVTIADALPMTCDPRSLEDCTALAMGLQLRATRAQVAGEPVDAALDNAGGLIRKHVRALESGKLVLGPHDEVPMDVNTAIHSTLASI